MSDDKFEDLEAMRVSADKLIKRKANQTPASEPSLCPICATAPADTMHDCRRFCVVEPVQPAEPTSDEFIEADLLEAKRLQGCSAPVIAEPREWVISWNDDGEAHRVQLLTDSEDYEKRQCACNEEGRDWSYDRVIEKSAYDALKADALETQKAQAGKIIELTQSGIQKDAEIERLRQELDVTRADRDSWKRAYEGSLLSKEKLRRELEEARAHYAWSLKESDDATAIAHKERDAALAEVERLRDMLDDLKLPKVGDSQPSVGKSESSVYTVFTPGDFEALEREGK